MPDMLRYTRVAFRDRNEINLTIRLIGFKREKGVKSPSLGCDIGLHGGGLCLCCGDPVLHQISD